MMEYFDDMSVIATPVTIINDISSGYNVPTPTNGTAVKGVLFTPSKAATYFTNLYAEEVTAVFVTSDVTQIFSTGKLTVNSITYDVDAVDDVGLNNFSGWDNVYTVALKAVL